MKAFSPIKNLTFVLSIYLSDILAFLTSLFF